MERDGSRFSLVLVHNSFTILVYRLCIPTTINFFSSPLVIEDAFVIHNMFNCNIVA